MISVGFCVAVDQPGSVVPDGPKVCSRASSGYLYLVPVTVVAALQDPEAPDVDQLQGPVEGGRPIHSRPATTSCRPMLATKWVAWDHTARLINARRRTRPRSCSCRPSRAEGPGFHAGHHRLAFPRAPVARPREADRIHDPAPDADHDPYPTGLLSGPLGRRYRPSFRRKSSSRPMRWPSNLRSKDAVPSLLPVGLGAQGNEFKQGLHRYLTRIVINNEDVQPVLNDQAAKLQAVTTRLAPAAGRPIHPVTGRAK